MCDPPPDDESHHKGTKFYPYSETILHLIFPYFFILHTSAEMCRLFSFTWPESLSDSYP